MNCKNCNKDITENIIMEDKQYSLCGNCFIVLSDLMVYKIAQIIITTTATTTISNYIPKMNEEFDKLYNKLCT